MLLPPTKWSLCDKTQRHKESTAKYLDFKSCERLLESFFVLEMVIIIEKHYYLHFW